MNQSEQSSVESEPAIERSAAETLSHLGRLEEAEQNLIRERSAILGELMSKLALAENGLGDSSVDVAQLRTAVHELIAQLGMSRYFLAVRRKAVVDDRTAAQTTAVARKIKHVVDRDKISLRNIAKRTGSGISPTTVSRVVNGEASFKTTLLVARALNIDTQKLLSDE